MTDILNAIKVGNIEFIMSYVKENSIDDETVQHWLKICPSDKVAAAIKLLCKSHESGSKATEVKSVASKAIGDISKYKPESEEMKQCSDESDETIDDLSESEARAKYPTKNAKVDKAVQMLLNSLKQNIKSIKYGRATRLSVEIAELIFDCDANSFPKIIRSKVHNLKENAKLCEKVYSGEVSPPKFAEMSVEDMKSEEMKSQDDNIIKESLLASQAAKAVAETDMFQCGRCKERKCTYSQLQTRSCDEPMTTFVHCTVCGNRWKF